MALININSQVNIIKNNKLGEDVRDAICEAITKVNNNLPTFASNYSVTELSEILQ